MERNIAQIIKDGSPKFRIEIEFQLNIAERTFGKLNSDLRDDISQVENKFSENDGGNATADAILQALMEQNMKTQQARGHERRERARKGWNE